MIFNQIFSEIIPAEVQNLLKKEKFVLNFSGLPDSIKSFLLAALLKNTQRNIIFLTTHPTSCHQVFFESKTWLENFGPEVETKIFSGFETGRGLSKIFDPQAVACSLEIIQGFTQKSELKKSQQLILASARDILAKFFLPKKREDIFLSFKVGAEINYEKLWEKLINFGYERAALIEEPGQLAKRGGVVDIFPGQLDEPLRLEFAEDKLVSLRIFDVKTQISQKKINEAVVFPVKPFSQGKETSFLENIAQKDILIIDEPAEIILAEEFLEKISGFSKIINFYQFTPEISENVFNFKFSPVTEFNGRIEEIKETLASWLVRGRRILIASRLKKRVEEILENLSNRGNLKIISGPLSRGFIFEPAGLSVLSDQELFGFSYDVKSPAFAPPRQGTSRDHQLDLKEGDYLVHSNYGIGQYQGLEKLKIAGAEAEYLFINYAGGDKLFVPAHQLEMIQKYTGFTRRPALTRLAGESWSRTINRVKKFTGDMAQRLYFLYQKRRRLRGFAFPKDTTWQKEMEDGFPYQETAHQAGAISAVKKNMEEPAPMERIIVGDVGYGKTEVALRAAFKAAVAGKQVAVLAPTTILVEQHFENFQKRLSAFPVKVVMLSRFKKRTEQKKIVRQIAQGQADIVIGTHRLLGEDVNFKDLGLLIIDEEQRFGVAAKEKLKAFKAQIDVLILSATPIPRTFSLAVSGICDMSLINTPPEERLPIKTTVTVFNQQLIKDAIIFELEREGQVFFVHNRIQSLGKVKDFLLRLLPGLKISVVHGRMKENEIEKTMFDFKNNQTQLLLATSIVENGLDLPNVNTLIVDNSERFGLAELYQLRGRVGRSDRQAYAYLLYDPADLKTPSGRQRLQAIKDFSNLGDGYKIALKDLEIRGAGTFFGTRQHGHVAQVGFELYTQILEESVKEVKGEVVPEKFEPELKLNISAFFPKEYIEEETVRLAEYQRLLRAASLGEIEKMALELKDRFGAFPPPVANLLAVAAIKLLARQLKIKIIERRKDQVILNISVLSFREKAKFQNRCLGVMKKLITTDENVIFKIKPRPEGEWLTVLKNTLLSLLAES